MEYYINYTSEGRILGFLDKKCDTDLSIKVSNAIWFENQGMNKVIVDGDNISFDNVDWKTADEIDEQIQNEFRLKRDNLLNTVVDHYQKPLVWETLTVEQQDKVRVYRQALLDSTTNWILPEGLVL